MAISFNLIVIFKIVFRRQVTNYVVNKTRRRDCSCHVQLRKNVVWIIKKILCVHSLLMQPNGIVSY